MCCCEVICILWRSVRSCCLCIPVRKGVHLIHCVDIVELLINSALVYYYYLMVRDSITLVPFALILFGNLVPLASRLLGMVLRVCGAMRLWTRGAVFCSRLSSLICMLILVFFQVMTTFFVLNDKVERVDKIPAIGPLLETDSTAALE